MASNSSTLAVDANSGYRLTGTTNAVKLLPRLRNINGQIGLVTEINSGIQVGETVYITYRYTDTNSYTLDNYLDYFHDDNYPFIDYVNGYKVVDTQLENNIVVINKSYSNVLNTYQINEHYLSTRSVDMHHTNIINNYVNLAKIDSTLFKNVYINATEMIDITQAYILSGSIKNVHFNDKYPFKYLSLNTDLSGSSYSYNNKNFGYTYCYGIPENKITIDYCTIDNGWFYYCNVSASTINGGYYENCYFSATTINKGYFTNCVLDSACTWNNGSWDYKLTDDPSGLSFGCLYWVDGNWYNGVFPSGHSWYNGTFYNGTFYGIWYNGIFNGRSSITDSGTTYSSIFLGSEWKKGTFNGGKFGDLLTYGSTLYRWDDGVVNGGDFFSTHWLKGSFKSGSFNNGTWETGDFSGNFQYTGDAGYTPSVWQSGTFYNGTMTLTNWNGGEFRNGTMLYSSFSGGTFFNGSFVGGTFYIGKFNSGDINVSTWVDGIFYNGNFYNSEWLNGDWYNGVANNSNFLSVNWSGGTFNSGTIFYSSASTGAWYGGNFNDGIFGYSTLKPLDLMDFSKGLGHASSPDFDFYESVDLQNYSALTWMNDSNNCFYICDITATTKRTTTRIVNGNPVSEISYEYSYYTSAPVDLRDINFWTNGNIDYFRFKLKRQITPEQPGET